MTQLGYLLPTLVCPLGMGVMMWLMMRGKKSPAPVTKDTELQQLRSEVDALRASQGSTGKTLPAETARV